MPDKYYQEYGPIRRRRATGELGPDEPLPLPPEDEPPPRRRGRGAVRPRRRGLAALLALVCLGVGGFLALPYLLGLFASDRVHDGVSLQGEPLGGKRRAELVALLDQRYGAFQRAPLTITFEGRSWTPSLAQLGARLDTEQTADSILAAGRRGSLIERAQELWSLWRGGLDIAPRISVDARALQSYLASIAGPVERPPRDAALSFAEGKVLPTAAQTGRQLLADTTAIEIMRALQTLAPQSVVLRTRTLEPRLADSGIAPAVAQARTLLSAPLTLRRGDQTWTWEPSKLAELLALKVDRDHMTVAVDPDRLANAVENLAQVADSGSSEPRAAFRSGKMTITQPGAAGWRIKQSDAASAISETMRLTKREVILPVEELTPQVTAKTLASLGVNELIGEGRSSFAGSAAYRITNIKAGAARMNGVLIPPGQEFSFNTQLGAVDETNGFVKGYAVIGQRTQLEWGGGVCQDSTTVYRAAFWAGLPITERHAHPFYISWYDDYSYPSDAGPGMDATIYTGVLDLKFVNDTGHWLLMEAIADDDAQVLTVRLYGTKPNRTVTVKGPEIDRVVPAPSEPVIIADATLPAGTVKQTDHARRGMDIAVYRVITENGVQKTPETFFTRFKAWPDVFLKGTGQ